MHLALPLPDFAVGLAGFPIFFMSTDYAQFDQLDASELSFCIVAARYNGQLVDALIKRVTDTLRKYGADEQNISLVRVPGSNELPYVSYMEGLTGQYQCVIALGVIISGETRHDEIIATSSAQALHYAGIRNEVPVINGVLTVEDVDQAKARVFGDYDRGGEFARAAIEMAHHHVRLVDTLDELEAAYEEIDEDDDEDGLDDDQLKRLFDKN